MRKSILILDTPESCDECPLFGNHYSDLCCKALNNRGINYPYPKDFRQSWCPLRSVPQEQEIWYEDERSDWERGYNNCVREIMGAYT